ncbi:O-antigen ligase family protein [Amylibacter sp.]|nr:O-antigen ligase family protein [Amylibacter sp.]
MLLTPIFANYKNLYFNVGEALESAIQVFIFFTIIMLCGIRNITENLYNKIIRTYLLISLYVCLFGIYQFISLNFIELPFDRLYYSTPSFAGTIVESYFNGWIRACSIFKEPGHFGFFVANSLIISTFVSRNFISLKTKIFHSILASIALLLSNSLTAFLGVLIIFSFTAWRKIGFFRSAILISLFFTIFIFLFPEHRIILLVSGIMSGDLSSLGDGSAITRVLKIMIGISIFLENPIFGIGGNQIGYYPTTFLNGLDWNEYGQKIYFTNFHILGILAESGIIGLLCYVIAISLGTLHIQKHASKNTKLLSIYLLIFNVLSFDLPVFSPFRLLPLIIAFSINIERKINNGHR